MVCGHGESLKLTGLRVGGLLCYLYRDRSAADETIKSQSQNGTNRHTSSTKSTPSTVIFRVEFRLRSKLQDPLAQYGFQTGYNFCAKIRFRKANRTKKYGS